MTHKQLKEIIKYDPNTGIFTWVGATGRRCRVGEMAGTIKTTEKNRIIICINKKLYKAHRLAYFYMTGKWPEHEIDHIDHNMSNNKWDNLRPVSRSQNFRNLPKPKTNSSGITGVHFNKRTNRWVSYVGIYNKRIHLGTFGTIEEAISMRLTALDYYGFHYNHGN